MYTEYAHKHVVTVETVQLPICARVLPIGQEKIVEHQFANRIVDLVHVLRQTHVSAHTHTQDTHVNILFVIKDSSCLGLRAHGVATLTISTSQIKIPIRGHSTLHVSTSPGVTLQTDLIVFRVVESLHGLNRFGDQVTEKKQDEQRNQA